MDLLSEAREIIDRVDSAIAKLFVERMDAVEKVAVYKKENGMAILDSSREAAVIEKNSAKVDEKYRVYYIEFLQSMMDISKKYQTDKIINSEE